MSVLIKNMEMPKDGETVTVSICFDGITFEEFKELGDVFHAVPVPPHGRLIDADALMGRIEHDTPLSSTFEKIMRRYIEKAPTVIEAEEE